MLCNVVSNPFRYELFMWLHSRWHSRRSLPHRSAYRSSDGKLNGHTYQGFACVTQNTLNKPTKRRFSSAISGLRQIKKTENKRAARKLAFESEYFLRNTTRCELIIMSDFDDLNNFATAYFTAQ